MTNLRFELGDFAPEVQERIRKAMGKGQSATQNQNKGTIPIEQKQPPKRNKFGAVKTEYNGITYDSKAEAKFAEGLDLKKRAGTVLWWTRQVPFYFSSGIVYRVDFMAMYKFPWPALYFYEVKGHETKEWKLKMKLMATEYPEVNIEVVK